MLRSMGLDVLATSYKTKAKKGDAQGQGKGQSQYAEQGKPSNPFVCVGYCMY